MIDTWMMIDAKMIDTGMIDTRMIDAKMIDTRMIDTRMMIDAKMMIDITMMMTTESDPQEIEIGTVITTGKKMKIGTDTRTRIRTETETQTDTRTDTMGLVPTITITTEMKTGLNSTQMRRTNLLMSLDPVNCCSQSLNLRCCVTGPSSWWSRAPTSRTLGTSTDRKLRYPGSTPLWSRTARL